MALFNIGGPRKIHPLVEVPGKIYVFGQAHDVSTLTPVFGDFLRGRDDPDVTSVAGYSGVETISMSGDSFVDKNVAISNPYFYPLVNELSTIKTYQSLPLGDGDYLVVSGGKRKLCTATKYNSEGVALNSVSLSCMGAAIVHEDELNVYCVGTASSKPSVGSWTIFNINKSNLSVGLIRSHTLGSTSSGVYMATAYPIAKDDTGVTIISYEYTGTGSAGGSPTATQFAVNPNKNIQVFKISNGGIVTKSASMTSLGRTMEQTNISIPNDGSFIRTLYETPSSIICGFFSYTKSTETTATMYLFSVDKSSLAVTQLTTPSVSLPDSIASIWTSHSAATNYRTHMLVHALRESDDSVKFLLTSYANLPASSLSGNAGTSFTLSMTLTKGETPVLTIDSTKIHRSNAGVTAVISLNESKDQFFISYNVGGGDFLQLNPITGDVITKNFVEFPIFTGMVDQVGRFWAQDDSTGSIHLFGPTTSATLRVKFSDNTLTYVGTPFLTKLSVSAFNYMGERVVNNVRLTIDGNSATFVDGGNSTTVATLAGGDIEVPVKIVGNGFVRVAASLAV